MTLGISFFWQMIQVYIILITMAKEYSGVMANILGLFCQLFMAIHLTIMY